MPDTKILEVFPNPAPERDFLIEHTHHEFTSLCPITGHPDFANITVRYVPDKVCVELKSLKLYFHSFRNEGIFFEAATNKICDDLWQVPQAPQPHHRGRLEGPRRLFLRDHRRLEAGEETACLN
jgi:7-cyano-7-deazaguanine reductase